MGLFKLGKISLDGTKVKANASKHKAMSWGYANKLEAQLLKEVNELLKRAAQADAQDEFDIDIPDESPVERIVWRRSAKPNKRFSGAHRSALRRNRLEYETKLKKRQAKAAATGKKAKGREPAAPTAGPGDKDQVNFTDAESRIMPSSEGFVQAYNAQAAVDIESHLIVGHHVTQNANDKQEIVPALQALQSSEAVLGEVDALLADAGYFSEDNVRQCEAAGITPYISDHRERHHLPWDERFETPPACPDDADSVTAMAHRLRTKEGKALYAKRKSTVETVFGIVKEAIGFRRFHLRGFDAVQGEWNLVCMAWNMKRMYTLVK